jgi:hypothetical protein
MSATPMVRVPEPVYRQLRTESLRLQFELGRQIAMGEIIGASLAIALNHAAELTAALQEVRK